MTRKYPRDTRQHILAEKVRPVADDAAAMPRKTKNNAMSTAQRMANDSGCIFQGLRVNLNDSISSSPQQAIIPLPSCHPVYVLLIFLSVNARVSLSHSLTFCCLCHASAHLLSGFLFRSSFSSYLFIITSIRPWLLAEMEVQRDTRCYVCIYKRLNYRFVPIDEAAKISTVAYN